jgi:hemerythrin-like domain-containing protein
MTTATETLRHDHEAILKMLDVTEEVAGRLNRGEGVRQDILGNLLEFFRLFADRCHHGKEEDLLFPLLETKGIPVAGGPIGVMLSEHEQGRSLDKEMREAGEAYQANVEGAGRRWAQAARSYVSLLRTHIHKENDILFVMAERVLSPEEQTRLVEGFEKLEVEKMGAGTHERLHAMMKEMLAEIMPRFIGPSGDRVIG